MGLGATGVPVLDCVYTVGRMAGRPDVQLPATASWRGHVHGPRQVAVRPLIDGAVERVSTERAATLLGAAGALQERQGNAWPPGEEPHLEHGRSAVADVLDREQLERAWSAGRRMSSAEAVRYAVAGDGSR
jgi:hypothetical protein